jgi:hypothetical protein
VPIVSLCVSSFDEPTAACSNQGFCSFSYSPSPGEEGGGVAFAQVSGLGVRNKCQVCYYRQCVSVPLMEAKRNGVVSSFAVKKEITQSTYTVILRRVLITICRGEVISITYCECVSVASAIQHARRMHRVMLSSVGCLASTCFS